MRERKPLVSKKQADDADHQVEIGRVEPDEECTNQSIKDAICRLEEAIGELDPGSRPEPEAEVGESSTAPPADRQASVKQPGSPDQGDPHAPHVGPTDLGWGQITTIEEVRNGRGAIVPEARVFQTVFGDGYYRVRPVDLGTELVGVEVDLLDVDFDRDAFRMLTGK